MPHTIHLKRLLLVGCCLALWACGKANPQSTTVSAVGKHAANWLVEHRRAYQQAPASCTECHGADLTGGITKIDCFNQGGLATCHAGGHGPRRVPHALPFTAGSLHGPVAKLNLVDCQVCHGEPGGPGTNPRFNVVLGSLSAGCETSGCHNLNNPGQPEPNAAHPVPWSGHASSGNQMNACALCHGADFGGTASGGVGPACRSCHTSLALGNLPTAGTCVSCHGNPPPTGSHAAHLAIASISCASCHAGGGSGSANHGSGTVTLAFPGTLNAKSGNAAVTGTKSCSAVSCHGGIATPIWGSAGSIDLATDCLKCHTDGTATPNNPPQYNSFRSGQHAYHYSIGLACTDCHDMTVTVQGASHFSGLTTTGFELAPAATMRSYLSYNATQQSCMPPALAPNGNTIGACHSDRRSW